MKAEKLLEYNGHLVCFSYRIKYHDPGYNCFTREVVYDGICYDIRFQFKGKPPFPEVHLIPMKTYLIGKMSLLVDEQLNSLERAVLVSLHSRRNTSVRIELPMYFDRILEE